MAKFTWQNGTLVSKAKVEINGTIYEVDPEEYSGATPLSAGNLNAMQDGIYEDIGNKSNLSTDSKTNLVSAINEVVDYGVLSTTEKVVGAWIDDKPLYKAVINGNLGSTVNSFNKVSDLNFDKVVSLNGVLISSEGDCYPIPRYYNNEGITLYASKTQSCIYESHNYSWANGKTVMLTVLYTKN